MLNATTIFTVLQSLDDNARKDLTPLKLRAKATKFAKATVKTQMSSFKVITYFIIFILLLSNFEDPTFG